MPAARMLHARNATCAVQKQLKELQYQNTCRCLITTHGMWITHLLLPSFLYISFLYQPHTQTYALSALSFSLSKATSLLSTYRAQSSACAAPSLTTMCLGSLSAASTFSTTANAFYVAVRKRCCALLKERGYKKTNIYIYIQQSFGTVFVPTQKKTAPIHVAPCGLPAAERAS